MKEVAIYEHLARYLNLQYPHAMYHFDLSGVNNASPVSRGLYSRLNERGWPDLFIAEARNGARGLFLEIKTETAKVYKRDGHLVANEHVREQADMLARLRERGYKVSFACGLDEAIQLVDEYMGKAEARYTRPGKVVF